MSISRSIAAVSITTILAVASSVPAFAQEIVIVRPKEIDEVLTNPAIGFMTFQRFNGDALNVAKRWTDADIRTWLPGDNLYDDTVLVPSYMPAGEYDLQIGILDPLSKKPKVKLAISGKEPDGWYYLGKIKIGN